MGPSIEFKENAEIRQIHGIFGTDSQFPTMSFKFKTLVHLKLCVQQKK